MSNKKNKRNRAMDIVTINDCSTVQDCSHLPKFLNFGWESLYKQNKINMINVLDTYSNISRLFALSHFTDEDIIINIVIDKRINQHPEAILLTNQLKDIIPRADPIYLDLVGEMYAFNINDLSEFLENITTKKKDYPKLEVFKDKVQVFKTIKSLTTNFNVEEFLRMVPDPEKHFKTIKINSKLLHYYESKSYLKNRFNRISSSQIRSTLAKHNFNLTLTVEALETNRHKKKLKYERISFTTFSSRKSFKTTDNLEFLKEMAYLDHKIDIINYLKSVQLIRQIQIAEARENDHLKSCVCCYANDLLDSEVCCCPDRHFACFSCIKSNVEFGVGNLKFGLKCLYRCNKEYDMSIIKEFFDDKFYQYILKIKQIEEIKAADIEGLETCAFCDYSVILSPEIKIINCLNPECKKETCRECREENHTPLKCDQVVKSPELQVRTMIENKLNAVFVRICCRCQRKFVKDDGCNKMTCSCGQSMCYICRQPVKANYEHYYYSDLVPNKCPLYINENIIHSTAVEVTARMIINELKASQPEMLSKIDIDKILPDIQEKPNIHCPSYYTPAEDVSIIVAKLLGESVENINNLRGMGTPEPPPPPQQTSNF